MNYKFAQRLADVLDKKGIKQTELAKRTGLSDGMISQYLGGMSLPKEENMEKIATVLEVPVAWLRGYDLQVGNEELMAIYNSLSLTGKNEVLRYAEYILTQEKKNVQG